MSLLVCQDAVGLFCQLSGMYRRIGTVLYQCLICQLYEATASNILAVKGGMGFSIVSAFSCQLYEAQRLIAMYQLYKGG